VKNPWVCGRTLRSSALLLAAALAAATPALTADGVPIISPRGYVSGSAKVTVSGSFNISADIPINKQASMSDGEMTWLQYGVSGAAEPNMLLTVSSYEVGFGVARGKATATAGAEDCKGDMKVETAAVSGTYKCLGVTSYDPSTGQMGTVDIEIQFVATS